MRDKYVVARYDTIEKLQANVNLLLENGWVCQGGICINTDNGNYTVYAQAMIKGEKNDGE